MLVSFAASFVEAGMRFAYCNDYANHFHLHALRGFLRSLGECVRLKIGAPQVTLRGSNGVLILPDSCWHLVVTH